MFEKRTFLAMLCLLCFGVLQAQTYTVSPAAVVQGYSGQLTLTGTNTNFTCVSPGYIEVTHNGTSQTYQSSFSTTFSSTSFQAGITIPSAAPPGLYNVELIDQSGFCFFNVMPNAFSVISSLNAAHVSGKIIQDNNLNCTEDGGDVPLDGRVVTVSPGPYYGLTNSNGEFGIDLPPGNYSVEISLPDFHVFNCPAQSSIAVNVPNSGDSATADYYLEKIPVQDLRACISPLAHRPGFNSHSWITVNNQGSIDVNNVNLLVVMDTLVSYVSANPAPTSVSGDSVQWALGTLVAGSQQSIQLTVLTPQTATLGDSVRYDVRINPIAGDTTAEDNICTVWREITGSYDPNDKRAWTTDGRDADGDIYPQDTLLRYMIRFQNTGTDTAFNVSIKDTIDANLNLGTFKFLGSSHAVNIVLDSNALDFQFDNILLPDSFVNEPASNGFVEYTIRLKSGLPLQTRIDNTAAIYFDFNPPVITNTVMSTIVEEPPLARPEPADATAVQVFPNPTTGHFVVRLETLSAKTMQIRVFDVYGRMLAELPSRFVSGTVQQQVDLQAPANGHYLVQITLGSESIFKKVMVNR